jgi:hypothetical protein
MAAPAPRVRDEAEELAFSRIGMSACPTIPEGLLPNADAFRTVFRNLLAMDENSPLYLYFQQGGEDNLPAFLSWTTDMFGQPMEYRDPITNRRTSVPMGARRKASQLIDFYNHNLNFNGGVPPDLENCAEERFEHFKMTWSHAHTYPRPVLSHAPLPVPGRPAHTPLSDFQKGVKRNVSDYPDLDSDKDFISWSEKVFSQAVVHQTDDVLAVSPPYVPVTPEEISLFNYKKAYMYSVFSTIVKTSAGRDIIRRFANSRDGHGAYLAIRQRYVDSPMAKLALANMLQRITNAKLTSSYEGTYEDYIDEFCQLLRDFNNTCSVSQIIPEQTSIEYLHQALMGVAQLSPVMTTIQLNENSGAYATTPLRLDHVVAMYKVASTQSDYNRKAKPANRLANQHFQDYDYDNNDDDAAYQIFLAGRRSQKPARDPNRPKRPGLPPEIWATLTREERIAWDVLSDTAKLAVMHSKGTPPAARSINTTETHDGDEYHDAPESENETDNAQRDANVGKSTPTSKPNDATSRGKPGSLGTLFKSLESGKPTSS